MGPGTRVVFKAQETLRSFARCWYRATKLRNNYGRIIITSVVLYHTDIIHMHRAREGRNRIIAVRSRSAPLSFPFSLLHACPQYDVFFFLFSFFLSYRYFTEIESIAYTMCTQMRSRA